MHCSHFSKLWTTNNKLCPYIRLVQPSKKMSRNKKNSETKKLVGVNQSDEKLISDILRKDWTEEPE